LCFDVSETCVLHKAKRFVRGFLPGVASDGFGPAVYELSEFDVKRVAVENHEDQAPAGAKRAMKFRQRPLGVRVMLKRNEVDYGIEGLVGDGQVFRIADDELEIGGLLPVSLSNHRR